MRTVADTQNYTAYHIKHCWQAFQGANIDDFERPWTPKIRVVSDFYAPQLVPAGTAESRISYGNSVCLSICPSVTTRWYTKPRWDRDPGSSPYGSLEYL